MRAPVRRPCPLLRRRHRSPSSRRPVADMRLRARPLQAPPPRARGPYSTSRPPFPGGAGGELQETQLVLRELRAPEGVVLALGEQLPVEAGEFSRHGHRRDAEAGRQAPPLRGRIHRHHHVTPELGRLCRRPRPPPERRHANVAPSSRGFPERYLPRPRSCVACALPAGRPARSSSQACRMAGGLAAPPPTDPGVTVSRHRALRISRGTCGPRASG
jgi:hypothetical protein